MELVRNAARTTSFSTRRMPDSKITTTTTTTTTTITIATITTTVSDQTNPLFFIFHVLDIETWDGYPGI